MKMRINESTLLLTNMSFYILIKLQVLVFFKKIIRVIYLKCLTHLRNTKLFEKVL